MRNKKDLIDILEKKSNYLMEKDHMDKAKMLQKYLYEKYNLPMGTTSDYICRRVDFNGISEFNLFIYADGVSYLFPNAINIPEYFVDKEIRAYTNNSISKNEIEFPIEINCIQVRDNQWIGSIDARFLLEMRKFSLINYNSNAQRILQKIIKGGNEYFKIFLNKKAVESIKESMKLGMYFPNTITLNIPTDTDYDYEYSNGKLKIKKLEHFDISDGYHRYIALTQLCDEDESFNYPMEVRITNYDDSLVRHFIFQEDQKTKMKKIDSESMSLTKESNLVCDGLNNALMFPLNGKISRENSIIDSTVLSDMIDKIYYKGNQKSDVKYRNDVINSIKKGFTEMIEQNPIFANEKYSRYRIASSLICIKYLEDKSNIANQVLELESYLQANSSKYRNNAKLLSLNTMHELMSIINK